MAKTQSFDEIYEKVKTAVGLEVKYQYIDFDGRKMNFSKFMITTLRDILNRIHKTEKQSISLLIDLFESYHVDSLSNRRYTIDKTLETFARLRKIIKTPQNKPEIKEKREFQDSIDEIDVAFVKGVGPQLAKIFNKMNIFKVKDLLEYYPRKYADYKGRTKISQLKLSQQVTLIGTIDKVYSRTTKSKLTIITIIIKDNSGSIPINLFLKAQSHKFIERYKAQYPINSLCMVLGTVKFDEYSSKTTLDKVQI
ncbi:hypothetical protein IJ531_01345, partial [bacterium]|nr:hypothetical protein [bacterium]